MPGIVCSSHVLPHPPEPLIHLAFAGFCHLSLPPRQVALSKTIYSFRDVQLWTCAPDIGQRISEAHFFDERFRRQQRFQCGGLRRRATCGGDGVRSLRGGRSGHWVKGGGAAKGDLWLASALEKRTIASLTPGLLPPE